MKLSVKLYAHDLKKNELNPDAYDLIKSIVTSNVFNAATKMRHRSMELEMSLTQSKPNEVYDLFEIFLQMYGVQFKDAKLITEQLRPKSFHKSEDAASGK